MKKQFLRTSLGRKWLLNSFETELGGTRRKSSSSAIMCHAALALVFAVMTTTSTSTKEVATNQFQVLLKPSIAHLNLRELADQVAKENGFQNLGPVSNPVHLKDALSVSLTAPIRLAGTGLLFLPDISTCC